MKPSKGGSKSRRTSGKSQAPLELNEVDQFHSQEYEGSDVERSQNLLSDNGSSDEEFEMMGLPSSRLRRSVKISAEEAESSNVSEFEDSDGESAKSSEVANDWGVKAGTYYEKEDKSDDESESDDEESTDNAVTEAEKLNALSLSKLKPEHYNVDVDPTSVSANTDTTLTATSILAGLQNDEEEDENTDVTKLSKADFKLYLKKNHKELKGLLKELKETSTHLHERILPVIERVSNRELMTTEGISYLEMKQHLLMSYIQYLLYYLLLKLHGKPVKDHPVIERLMEIKTLMGQLRLVDKKMEPQLSRLLRNANQEVLKPRVDMLEVSDEEKQSAEEGPDTNIYKPPKVLSMEYAGTLEKKLEKKLAKEREREFAKMKNSDLVKSLREEVYETPLEITEDSSFFESKARLLERMKEDEEIDELEEDRMVRSRLNKKEKRLRSRSLRKLNKIDGGNTLENLAEFAEASVKSTFDPSADFIFGSRKKQKLSETLSLIHKEAAKTRTESGSDKKKSKERIVTSSDVGLKYIPQDDEIARERGESYMDAEEDLAAANAEEEKMARKEEKKRARLEKKEKVKVHQNLAEGKRGTSYQIMKNKGLTKKRKKIEGSSRAHNKLKFQKKLKKAGGTSRISSRDVNELSYEGESTGIRSHVKRSHNFGA